MREFKKNHYGTHQNSWQTQIKSISTLWELFHPLRLNWWHPSCNPANPIEASVLQTLCETIWKWRCDIDHDKTKFEVTSIKEARSEGNTAGSEGGKAQSRWSGAWLEEAGARIECRRECISDESAGDGEESAQRHARYDARDQGIIKIL